MFPRDYRVIAIADVAGVLGGAHSKSQLLELLLLVGSAVQQVRPTYLPKVCHYYFTCTYYLTYS